MPHEHGLHECYCPECEYISLEEANIKCKTLTCPNDGSQMRAVETGEFRSIGQTSGVSIFLQILAATAICAVGLLILKPKEK